MTQLRKLADKFVICLVLGLLTLVTFWPLKDCDFVNFDDPDYVTDNPSVQGGLTSHSVAWAFQTGHAANWHPLTWLSHMLDWQLYGNNPAGHHATSLLFHIANVMLLFLFLNRMTTAFWRSAVVAALFALHPLHVESVAWISERKDVLCTFFFLLTIWAYVCHAQSEIRNSKSEVRNYLLALGCFALGLMSKPMIVTLPFVLLLLDFWPLRRISSLSTIRPLLLEKLPFFALALVSSIITVFVQQHGGSVKTFDAFPIGVRMQTIFIGYTSYIEKMFWPKYLGAFYTHPGGWPFWKVTIAAAMLLAISAIVFRMRRNRPWLLFGWLWFLGTLVPVIGLVQIGGQYIADRYTYIPLIGLFLMIVWSAEEFFSRQRFRKMCLAVIAGTILIVCSLLTRAQLAYWRSSVALFTHALEITRDTFTTDNSVGASLIILAHNNLGLALTAEGRLDEAIAHYSEALKIRPDLFNAHYGLGQAMADEGNLDDAITHYAAALKVRPDLAEVHADLGYALAKQGKMEKAASEFSEALRLKPNDAKAHFNLGLVLAGLGKTSDAIAEYHEALRLKPDVPDALNNLAWIFASSTNAAWRDGTEAVRLAKRACELTGHKKALMVGTLAAAYAASGKFQDAVTTAERARQIALAAGEKKVASRNEELLILYRANRAVYESPDHNAATNR